MSYKDLKSYRNATIIYDLTVEFCDRYINKRSRTHDQMVQAARSGKQNIVEGSSYKTSEKSELKLLGVARASFAELLEDYEDYLRQHKLRLWSKNEPKALVVRSLYKSDGSDIETDPEVSSEYSTYESYQTYLTLAEDAANAALCLIHQVNFLLDRQIKAAEQSFLEKGGYTEKLYRSRTEYRSNKSDKSDT